MRRPSSLGWPTAIALTLLAMLADLADARRPIRNDFFDAYPSAVGSRLDDLPSNGGHCGVCHLDFDGGGARNDYGTAIEVAYGSGGYPDHYDAILAIGGTDADGDGFTTDTEILETVLFANTPTFPGLADADLGSVINVDPADLIGYLVPSGAGDVDPPMVTVLTPDGGESLPANTIASVMWTASDPSGIAYIDVLLSDDDGLTWRPVARGLSDTGSYAWFVPNRPGSLSRIRVTAVDGVGNPGSDESDGTFTIVAPPGGAIPTTLRDFDLPGTQPLEGVVLDDPTSNCVTCHGGYDESVEPWWAWRGSMMGNAMRDPLFRATMTIAEQDAPSSGDLCLRCHTPGGWLEGRSVDTMGGLLEDKDYESVQCDLCHRQVDPDYEAGVSPPEDVDVLAALLDVPDANANGMFVIDPDPRKRGPYADATAPHAFLESPYHRSSDACGTCHDVSNPAFVGTGTPGEYVPDAFDAPHPDADLRNMFPVERTFSEWSRSEYATTGVYAPQFAGTLPDGIVSTCQDCHMPDAEGQGCVLPDTPVRSDLPRHDLVGGNTFVGDILGDFYPGEVDPLALSDAKTKAIALLQKAATLELATTVGGGEGPGLEVTVTNETGHKLPSGYPEGRRMWLHVAAYDAGDQLVYESGAYDPATGILTHDPDVKIYEIEPGISERLAPVLGMPAGPSFHFVLNDTVWLDNRIPPRGFTNAAFEEIQSPPVGHAYADGQYWDVTDYVLPVDAARVDVTLYYQTTSKEYVEFLRDENVTDSWGDDLYAAWVAHGRAAPVAMATGSIDVGILATPPADVGSTLVTRLFPPRPNPLRGAQSIGFTLAEDTNVSIVVHDATGRRVRTLVDGSYEAGAHVVSWDGRSDGRLRVGPGTYYCRLVAGDVEASQRVVVVR